jgi:predicted nucleic acid-binding protein
MRLAVFDTSVLVAAGINRAGAPATLISDWVLEGQVQLVVSPCISSEYREVMQRAKFFRYGFPPLWLEFLIGESLHMPDPANWPFSGPDAADLPFLALAHAAGARLVTGNLRHFPASVRNGVTVLSSAEYLAHLKEGDALDDIPALRRMTARGRAYSIHWRRFTFCL